VSSANAGQVKQGSRRKNTTLKLKARTLETTKA